VPQGDAWIGIALLGLFALLAIAEMLFPRIDRARTGGGDARLFTNFGLTIMVLLAGGLFPLARISSWFVGERLGVGFAQALHLPWLLILVALLLLDSFSAYWAHRLMHVVPVLWRVHRVHHADTSLDVSTTFRNHPLELLITVPVAALVVLLIGAPASVVVAAQTIFIAAKMWQHADIRLPLSLERTLGRILVTPAIHQIHHGRERDLHDSNFGDSIVLWDQHFGTFHPPGPIAKVGLDGQRARPDRLLQQIWSPLYPV
jgi:sterol desaturase/sphingolipid hydroxylase (fatty acid hydroxylase superfamily)